jgi:hypothetical protein
MVEFSIMKRAASVATKRVQARNLYDVDFVAWTQHTAALMREQRFNEIDVEHAAEEIEDMGKRDVRELRSRMQVLIAHLLKWKLQPTRRSNSWRATIRTQRSEVVEMLRQSPSLQQRLVSALDEIYDDGLKLAADQSGLKRNRFPSACPFALEELLDEDFLPQ